MTNWVCEKASEMEDLRERAISKREALILCRDQLGGPHTPRQDLFDSELDQSQQFLTAGNDQELTIALDGGGLKVFEPEG